MKGQVSVLLIVAGVVIALSGLWVYSAGNVLHIGNKNVTINNTLCFSDGTCLNSTTGFGSNTTNNFYNITNNNVTITVPNSSIQCIGGMALYNTSLTNGNLTGECIPVPDATTTLPYSNISGTPSITGTTIPANNVTSGNFTGIYSFDQNTSNTTFLGDLQVIGKIYGGSPVKIAGGLDVISGTATFNNIIVTSCIGCSTFNGTTNFSSVNVTNGTFINLAVTDNVSLPNNSILDQFIFSLNANKLFNLSALNNQIILDASNITNLPTAKVYNESGITRNYTVTGNLTGTLPQADIITMKGVVTTTNPESLLLTFNNDNTNSYLYRRIQGLVWLYQAVTVNPQKNITLEQYQSTAERDVTIVIYKTGTDLSGEFIVTAYTNTTLAPYKTTGSFNYKNTTEVNTFSILTSTTSNSYLTVTSESK